MDSLTNRALPSVRTIVAVWLVLMVPSGVARYIYNLRYFEQGALYFDTSRAVTQILVFILVSGYSLLGPLILRRALTLGPPPNVPSWLLWIAVLSQPILNSFQELGQAFWDMPTVLLLCLDIPTFLVWIFVLVRLGKTSKWLSTPDGRTGAPLSDVLENIVVPGEGLQHGVVRRELRARAGSADHLSTLLLNGIVLVVLIGGGASFLPWQLWQLSALRSLQTKLTEVSDVSEKLSRSLVELPEMEGRGESVKWMSRLRERTDSAQSKWPFEAQPDEAKARYKTGWEDTAIRAAIATLTVFLVQVLFSVYRYHRRLANILADRAEAMLLLAADDDAGKQLRAELIGLFRTGSVGFGAEPSNPVGDVVRLGEKVVERFPRGTG